MQTGYVEAREIRRLSRLTPWRTAMAICLDWAVIAAAIFLCEWTDSWLAWIVAVPVIAGRMHALAGLMHDFAHYRFIADKKLSDTIGNLLLAWPIGATVAGYRRNHLAHHNYTNSGRDPDWVVKLGTREYTFPQEMRFALLNFLGYFVGVSSLRDIRAAFGRVQDDDVSSRGQKLARIGFYVAIAVALTVTGTWAEYALYWAIPYLTVFFLLLYVRSVAEHFGETMEAASELNGTRTVIPHFWERWFFCPHHLNYHLDHHLYPSVPFYNLPALHAALRRNSKFAGEGHVTRGYATGLLREVWLDGWRRKAAVAAG
jgi:fatty acid desaturase